MVQKKRVVGANEWKNLDYFLEKKNNSQMIVCLECKVNSNGMKSDGIFLRLFVYDSSEEFYCISAFMTCVIYDF